MIFKRLFHQQLSDFVLRRTDNRTSWSRLKTSWMVMSSSSSQEAEEKKKVYVIEASVITGFEECAREEAREKLSVTDVKAAVGKITWTTPNDDNLKNVTKLKSINNASVVVISEPVKFLDESSSLASLQQMVPSMAWEQGLQVWQTFMPFPHTVFPRPSPDPSPEDLIDVVVFSKETLLKLNIEGKKKQGRRKDKKDKKKVEAEVETNKPGHSESILKQEGDQTSSDTPRAPLSPAAPVTSNEKERDPTKPTFRVTCNRVGDDHPFNSTSAAASLGSAVMNYHGWQVDLHNFDMEIFLNIRNNDVTVSIRLTNVSLNHWTNLVALGRTTLRSTICYNMLRLCHIENGDFICDPMCGTSAIPVESALNWSHCYSFGGDMHGKAIENSTANIEHLQGRQKEEGKGSLKLDAVQWDITHFPLRDRTVDVFVCDLPFGRRVGSRHGNKTLYPALLEEMARCARVGARACLLSEERNNHIMAKALSGVMTYWQRRQILSINMGGLNGVVFLLTRTDKPFIEKVNTDKVYRDSFDREDADVKQVRQEILDSVKRRWQRYAED